MNKTPTVLEIDTNAVRHNLRFFRSKLKPGTKLMVVVKALAYGSDGVMISRILAKEQVDYLAVTYIQEGVTIRKAGIRLPVLVLHPQIENVPEAVKHQLEPAFYNVRILNAFSDELRKRQIKNYPVHIKLNTGMNRLGFSENQLPQLIEQVSKHANFSIRSVYSHLASSDDTSDRAFTLTQIENFKRMYRNLKPVFAEKPFKHIANTSAILNYPEAHFDMVRLGIGFYGFDNARGYIADLKNVINLKTKISQIYTIKKGESVSYNRKFIAGKETKIASIPAGYADGIKRSFGNGNNSVYINGKKVPIIGTVCMDTTMIDVTGINCKEGDEVVIFDHQKHINELAEKNGTISYEILTSIGQRVRRKVI